MPDVMAPLRLALTMDEAAAALGCSRRSMLLVWSLMAR